MTESLSGCLACVTGSTRGVGRDIARALARAGADVIIAGRDGLAAQAVVEEVSALGVRAFSLIADVSEPDAFASGSFAEAPLADVDILVCCAGMTLPEGPLLSKDWNAYRRCFDLNIFGVMNAVQAVLPGMLSRRRGRIIAIGGTFGYRGISGHALYSASKWALRGLMKSLAQEVGRSGITVNVVAPGGIDGEKLWNEFEEIARREGLTAQEVQDRFASRSASGRLVTGEDVAGVVTFLVSPAGRLITGQDILVDGGTIV